MISVVIRCTGARSFSSSFGVTRTLKYYMEGQNQFIDAEDKKSSRPGVGVGVFVTSSKHPDCVLIGKRTNCMGAGLYALPGGHLEFGESWEECARREILEETGLKLKEVSFVHVNNAIHRPVKYHYLTIFMKGEVDLIFKEEPENTEPEKCEGWQWTEWGKIPPPEQLFWSLGSAIQEGFTLF